ncbi:MAG: polysaccharide biosynthesis C-terminal domain-containing protein, partial [Erysipelotrichaceae bacterium]|nr:polysaccharide biosynthesis C-terminal domain-containing protein [Erysipelotrichaceae bacterium]
ATSRNVILLYGEKWLPALPYMIIACLMFSLEAIQVINLQAIKSKGRSDIVLILEVIKKGYGIAILLITMRMGVYYIALGGLSQAIVALLCNTYPNVKLVNYRYSEQFKDILPPLFCSLIMCAAVYFVGGFFTNNYVALFVKVVTGVGLYVGISYFIQKENFNEVLALLKKFTNR